MKLIPTQDAVGHMLCHDMTQIIPGQYKGARFRKGHVVQPEDVPVLLSMGKEHLYVWELTPGMVHENDAAERLCALCRNDHMERTEAKEGKIELTAAIVNALEDIMIATRHGNTAVRKGGKLAGTRVIPLVIAEEKLRRAEEAAGSTPLLTLTPWKLKTAAVIATGNEVAKGLITDAFTPVVEAKLTAFGIRTVRRSTPGDDMDKITQEILAARNAGVDLILCTGGMSVDPDDRTPGAVRASGARVVSYGAPVLPGAMFLVSYLEGVPVLGLPGCVMYAQSTIFDLLLPRIAAGVPISRKDITEMGEGGLCLGCDICTYPDCGFGK